MDEINPGDLDGNIFSFRLTENFEPWSTGNFKHVEFCSFKQKSRCEDKRIRILHSWLIVSSLSREGDKLWLQTKHGRHIRTTLLSLQGPVPRISSLNWRGNELDDQSPPRTSNSIAGLIFGVRSPKSNLYLDLYNWFMLSLQWNRGSRLITDGLEIGTGSGSMLKNFCALVPRRSNCSLFVLLLCYISDEIRYMNRFVSNSCIMSPKSIGENLPTTNVSSDTHINLFGNSLFTIRNVISVAHKVVERDRKPRRHFVCNLMTLLFAIGPLRNPFEVEMYTD